jgi:hypothetical protein
MRKLLLIALFSASTVAWSATSTIDFEGTIETAGPVGGGGLPSRVYTQDFQFYSAGGFQLSSVGNIRLFNCPGCQTEIQTQASGNFDLESLDIVIAPPTLGNETVTLVGCYIETDCVSMELPVTMSWTTYNSFGEEWSNLFTLSVISNLGGVKIVGLDNIIVTTESATVEIDVLPGNEANKIYPNKGGKFPVAVLSSATFDATQVDPSTVKLGLGQAAPTNAPIIFNVDGLYGDDSTFKFLTESTGIFCNDTEVTLLGETYAGDAFIGTDMIDATNCVAGGCHPY